MKRGRVWIVAVVLLLVGNTAAVGVLIVLSGDPTSRVEPDYYRRAADWDDTMAEQRASLALGWTAEVSLIAGGAGAARLEVVVRDADGAPLQGARVDATVRHRSRTDHAVMVAPREQPGGHYLADVALAQRGLHVVEVEVTRGDQRFRTTAVVEPEGRP